MCGEKSAHDSAFRKLKRVCPYSGKVYHQPETMLHSKSPFYPLDQFDTRHIDVQCTFVVHSIKGYLAWCQDQYPEMDMTFFITGNEDLITPDEDKWCNLASLWKQCTQEMRRTFDEDAAKNEPHRGEPGEGGYGRHPRLTPYETAGVLEALLADTTDWNLDENDDDDDE